MSKTNSDYWRERFLLLEQELTNSSQVNYIQVAKAFDQAFKQINKEIEAWINRIAINNQLTSEGAKKLLNKNELDEFKWSVAEYIKKGKENAINQAWLKELENASAKYHINRLEAIKLSTRMAFEEAYNFEVQKVTKVAKNSYSEGYYRAIYELQNGFSDYYSVAKLDDNELIRIVSKPWANDGSNFSDRIWNQKTQMVNKLHNELIRVCATGEAPAKAIKNMEKYVDKNLKNANYCASRIIMTEKAFFSATAQEKVFNELDVERYEIVATLDLKTSKVCQSMDKKVFITAGYNVGVNAPPFHPNCRTTTAPYFDDEFSTNSKRIARDGDGNNIYVDSKTTYAQWKKKYIENK